MSEAAASKAQPKSWLERHAEASKKIGEGRKIAKDRRLQEKRAKEKRTGVRFVPGEGDPLAAADAGTGLLPSPTASDLSGRSLLTSQMSDSSLEDDEWADGPQRKRPKETTSVRKPRTATEVAPILAQGVLMLTDWMKILVTASGIQTLTGKQKDSKLCMAMLQGLKKFSMAAQAAGAGHQLGPPPVWILLEILNYYLEELPKAADSEAMLTMVRDIKQDIEKMEDLNEALEKYIVCMKVPKAFTKKGEQQSRKNQILVKNQQLQKLIIHTLCGQNFTLRKGTAPRSAVERDLQFFLDMSK